METDIDFAMGQDVCLIRSQLQSQRFLNYLLHSRFMNRQLEVLLIGSTFKRINISDIKALIVPVPPRKEQDAICEYLDPQLALYDRTVYSFEHEITLLQEYRTRLFADVVTGKLDVREVARNLPAETEASAEPMEDQELEAETTADGNAQTDTNE